MIRRGFASLYERGGRYYAIGHGTTTTGLNVMVGPVLALDASVTEEEELGRVVLEIIASTRFEVPQPSPADLRRPLPSLLKVAGVRSYRAFTQGAKYVAIDAAEGRCWVYPSHHPKPRSGYLFAGQEEWVVLDDPPDPAALGAAIRVALERSTPPPTPAPRGGG